MKDPNLKPKLKQKDNTGLLYNFLFHFDFILNLLLLSVAHVNSKGAQGNRRFIPRSIHLLFGFVAKQKHTVS